MAQFSKSLVDFDVDDAKKELQETLKRTNDIVKHFKSQNNKVLLIGGSYGGFIMGEYLKQYGTKTQTISSKLWEELILKIY